MDPNAGDLKAPEEVELPVDDAAILAAMRANAADHVLTMSLLALCDALRVPGVYREFQARIVARKEGTEDLEQRMMFARIAELAEMALVRLHPWLDRPAVPGSPDGQYLTMAVMDALEGSIDTDDDLNQGDACRICGCTNVDACDPPCHWVEADLCSRCEAREIVLATTLPATGGR